MRTHVIDGTEAGKPGAKVTAILRCAIARQQDFHFHADGICTSLTLLFAPGPLFLTAAASKEQAMSRKPHLLGKQLVIATALALGASSVALADDSSLNPFIGDSYRYFNGGNLGDPQFKRPVFSAVPADPAWRQSHPHGISERDLQALGSSSVSAAAEQLNPPVIADSGLTLRQAHQNLDESQMQALASSSASRWQALNGSESTAAASSDQANVAQNPSKETFSARLTRFFRPDSGSQGGAN